jgi:hypothetical protein
MHLIKLFKKWWQRKEKKKKIRQLFSAASLAFELHKTGIRRPICKIKIIILK